MVCSTGNATPIGSFKTPARYRWATLMGPSYGQYSTRIVKGFLFHSVWYYRNGDKASQSYAQYNKLGTTASHGCVRLTVADAKWIYDNCPLGTTVTIYNSSNPGPLGKPKAYKVPTNKKMGWDPTDPDSKNPYKKKPTITISSKKPKTVKKGSSTYNALQYVTAKSGLGASLTSKIKVSGKVDTKKVGKYTLTYTVKDNYGNKASKTFTVSVISSAPTISGVEDKLAGLNTKINVKSGIKAKDSNGRDITSKIKISVIGPDNQSVALSGNKLYFRQLGQYQIIYKVTGSSGKTTKKTATIDVEDRRVKLVTSDKTVKAGETTNVYLGVNSLHTFKGKALAIDETNIKIDGTLDLDTPGVYDITYIATEKNYTSRVTKSEVTITVTEKEKPETTPTEPTE